MAVIQPGPYAQALQGVLRDLLATRDGATYVYGRLSGLSIRYDLGSDQPVVGRDAPEFRSADGTRLADLLRGGRGVALDFTADQRLRGSVTGWADRVRYAAGQAGDDLGFAAVLVRPDGVVARAGEHGFDRAAFVQAAADWFGDSAPAQGATISTSSTIGPLASPSR
ncbi:aromatic-ring hydroxylase C-terminal domain-containing protein [Saccharothrix coeruleofusca]|uniref:aromatic-ring hydroxylase C-terminal domain-containing protein n=1 Tax=Saccharothrix coeruleofusca TaxID=33919 RepID=UPI0035579043